MRSFLLLLAIGLAAADKLDRTYLPPPGSKYAGGEPGDLQVPLEFPKETYTTTAPIPGRKNEGSFTTGDTRLVPGSTRKPGSEYKVQLPDTVPVTPASKSPFNYFQNTYKVPTTTTSYAFTQTTTFPPEAFETTPSPIGSGFPIDGSLDKQLGFVNQPFGQGQIFNQQTGQFQPVSSIPQKPGLLPTPGSIFPGVQGPFAGQPGFTPAHNINQQGFPVPTVSPVPGSSFQPGVTSSPYDQEYTQHLGVQPPHQFNQQGFIPSTTAAPVYQPGLSSLFDDNASNVQGTKLGGKSPISPISSPQQIPTQYVDKFGNVQTTVPGYSYTVPQQVGDQGQLYPSRTSIPGTSGPIVTSQQGQQISQTLKPQGSLPSIVNPTQQPETGQLGISGQQGVYQSPQQYQVTNIPGSTGVQQQESQSPQFSGQQNYLAGQGNQSPQNVIQQGNFPSTETPLGYGHSQINQRPQSSGQQTVYPSTGISAVTPGTVTQQQPGRQQPQINVQQGLYPSTIVPQEPGIVLQPQFTGQQGSFPTNPQGITNFGSLGNKQPQNIATQGPEFISSNQQGGQSQYTGQQNSFTPSAISPQGTTSYGQSIIQKPESNQQSLFPITETPQGSTTISSQLGGQLPQFNQQSLSPSGIFTGLPSSSQPGIYQQGGNVQGNISARSNGLPGQETFIGTQPGTQQNLTPFGRPQLTDNKIPSQQSITPRPGDQSIVTGSPQNLYGPGVSTPFYPSTTPSFIPTFPTYGSTPGTYPSSTPGSGVMPSIDVRPRPERPQADSDRNSVILNYTNVLTPDGYAYSYDTSNGIHADENGTTIDGTKAAGSYSYIGDDGKYYSVMYTADENGFQPHGDHLPTPPPVPKAIQEVIEQAARDKAAGISHNGFYDEAKYGHHKYQGLKHRRPGMQNNIVNGADIPDDYEISYEKKEDKTILRPKGKPGASTDDEKNLKQYDDNRYDGDNNDTFEEDEITNEKQPNRKISSGRPVNEKPVQYEYENEQDMSINKNKKIQQGQSRPSNRGQNSLGRQPGSPSRKEKPGAVKNQYDDEEKYDDKEKYDDEEILEEINGSGNRPDQISYDKHSKGPSKTSGNKYYEESRTELPGTSKRPQGIKRPGLSSTQGENSSYDLKQTSNIISQPKKSHQGPSKTIEMKYFNNDDGSEDQENSEEPSLSNQEGQKVLGRPKGNKKIGTTNTRYEQTDKLRPSIVFKDRSSDNIKYPEGSRFEHKGRPSYDQRVVISQSEYPEQSEDEETGYQYNPPTNKFDQGEINKFPSRISDKTTTSKYDIGDKKTTVRPFITPNVHRDEDDSYENVSQEYASSERPGQFPGTISEFGYETSDEYFEKQRNPVQDEEEPTRKTHPSRPGKPGTTRRPGYQSMQTTAKPGYYDEYTSDNEKMSNRGSRPGQKNRNRYPLDSDKQTIHAIGTSRRPGSTYVPSTTQMPVKKPYLPGSKQPSQQQEGELQYSTTYEPLDISSTEEDYSDGTPKSVSSTSTLDARKPLTKPGDFYGTSVTAEDDQLGSTRLPSTRPTFQTSYDFSDVTRTPGLPTIRPGISENAFGIPSTRPASPKTPNYSTVTASNRPGSKNEYYDSKKPGSATSYSESAPESTNYPDRNTSGSISVRPGISQTPGQSQKDLPSTTYRPNYSITDISQPGSVTVDTFGRPLKPVSGNRQPVVESRLPGTTRPGFSVSSQELPSTGRPTSVYQDLGVKRPGQSAGQINRFKPTEQRFGGAVQGIPGPKPVEFGPSSVTTPGYLSPYGHQTEKVVGEDFSGPKQPQKFDPETGYYY